MSLKNKDSMKHGDTFPPISLLVINTAMKKANNGNEYQSIQLQDATGETIYLSVWDEPIPLAVDSQYVISGMYIKESGGKKYLNPGKDFDWLKEDKSISKAEKLMKYKSPWTPEKVDALLEKLERIAKAAEGKK